jgi:hypothetical protein
VYANNPSDSLRVLKKRQTELLIQITTRQKAHLDFADLKDQLLEIQVAVFQAERGMPPQSNTST